MKILWITNILFPDICEELNMPVPVGGGWMYSLAKDLVGVAGIELLVATVYKGDDLNIIEKDGIRYILLPCQGDSTYYHSAFEKYWLEVRQRFNPQVIHIYGTEFAHGLAYVRACGNRGVLVSLQGLVSVCARYYYAGITEKEIWRNLTFRDIVRRDTIFRQKRKFVRRGEIEKEYIRSVKYVAGRTEWDRIHAGAINREVNYCFCNESLRNEFYHHQWSYEHCEKHTLFLSQAEYPLKGLHQVLKALPFVLNHYPDTKLYVGGRDITAFSGWKDKIRYTGYGRYVASLIKKLKVGKAVVFTGRLTEKQMCDRYLRAHVFIAPSSIENSPNSLGEAQILGVPCIGAYAGGIPEMITDGETGLLYRFEEYEMLAQKICQLFRDLDFCRKLSVQETEIARERHNRTNNLLRIMSIYRNMEYATDAGGL